MVIAFCEMPRLLFIFLLSFHKERLKDFTWSVYGNGRHRMKCATRSVLNGLMRVMTCCDPIWTWWLWSSWATFRRDKKTIVCEDGRRNIYKERHLKLKPDVCVCFCERVCVSASVVLGSRLPAMPFLFQWFFLRVCGFEEVFWVQLKERIKWVTR